MALLCIFYFIAVATCLSVVGLLAEHALPATASRRWVWCAVIASSLIVPILISAHHSSPEIGVWGLHLVRLPSGQAHSMASHGALDRNWLDCYSQYGKIFNKLWLFSTAVLLMWALTNALRVSRMARASRTARGDGGRHAIVDGVPVIVTDSTGPATVGLWRSRVLLPQWVLTLPGVQRQYVVRHEDEHRRAHDARLLWVMSILVSLWPWNLALWWQLGRLRLAVEMDCDSRVVSALGNATAYGELLLKVAQAASRGPHLQPGLLGGVGMLERRLAVLLAPAPRRIVRRVLALAIAAGLLFVVLSVPHPLPAHAHVGHAGHAALVR